MEFTHPTTVVLDAADLEAVSSFWVTLLGGSVHRAEDWHDVNAPHSGVTLAIQLAPDHQPPDWPDGAPQQIHLDFHVADIAAAHEEALAAGARLVQDADRSGSGGFVVYADPAGHPFCLCW